MARIGSRLVAFGSADSIAAFHRVGALDKKAFAAGLTEFGTRLNRELTS